MQGTIIKGIGGFYYVDVKEHGLYECKGKGIFRNQKIRPLPGDHVMIEVLDEEEKLGHIVQILERKNELLRPAVANVDQVLVVFAVADPNPNLQLIDRYLLLMERQGIPTILCFNKMDLSESGMEERLAKTYGKAGCELLFISTYYSETILPIRERLENKITVLAGPSGVGKSSLLNQLIPEAEAKTGAISEKIRRGKHTTRHSELMRTGDDTYIIDTPGFSTLYLDAFSKEELKDYYPEFESYEGHCRFLPCSHIHEPDCAVKQAVENREISRLRYRNYAAFYEELAEKEKHQY